MWYFCGKEEEGARGKIRYGKDLEWKRRAWGIRPYYLLLYISISCLFPITKHKFYRRVSKEKRTLDVS